MTRGLRQKHRAIVSSLAFILPVSLGTALVVRQPPAITRGLPSLLAMAAEDYGPVVWTRGDLWNGSKIITLLRGNQKGDLSLELLYHDLAAADLLLYWIPGKLSKVEALPDTARFVGTVFRGGPIKVPGDIRGEQGLLVIYSLANHEIVSSTKPFILQKG